MVLRGCPVCSRGAWAFEPLPDSYFGEWRRWGFPYAPEDFETLNVRDYACPSCHSPDRDRMCAMIQPTPSPIAPPPTTAAANVVSTRLGDNAPPMAAATAML